MFLSIKSYEIGEVEKCGIKCKTKTSFAQEKFRSTKDVFLENYLILRWSSWMSAAVASLNLTIYRNEIDILTQRTLAS